MLVTIVLALLTGAAALAVLLPLGRDRKTVSADDTDAHFYASQLAEIERDAGRGLLLPAEAEVARVEAARRMLAARRRSAGVERDGSAGWRRKAAAVVALAGIPLVSIPLYLSVGMPDMPGMPLASREPASNQSIDFDEAMARIEKHLAQTPDDGKGWEIVAPLYMNMGRYDDGVRAYASAVRLLGETAGRLENYGEALVAAADGIVTAEARTVLDKALLADPKLVKARFYRALAAEQDDDRPTAIASYTKLIEEAPPGSPIATRLADRIRRLGGTPPAGAAIAALPPGDQMAAIRGMVDGLAARLAQDGGDAEGWLRLVRSYAVLNETDKARDALSRGLAALAGDAAGRQKLEDLGRELRIGGS